MRASALLLLLVPALLAGCAASEPVSRSATFPESVPPPAPHRAPWTWVTLSEGGFILGPAASQHAQPLTIPEGTLKVLVNVTLETGASVDLQGQLGACQWLFPGPWAGVGQTLPHDCEKLLPGGETLTFSHLSGALAGRYRVDVLVCGAPHDRAGCW